MVAHKLCVSSNRLHTQQRVQIDWFILLVYAVGLTEEDMNKPQVDQDAARAALRGLFASIDWYLSGVVGGKSLQFSLGRDQVRMNYEYD